MINYSSQKYQKLKSKVKLFSFCFLDIYVNSHSFKSFNGRETLVD